MSDLERRGGSRMTRKQREILDTASDAFVSTDRSGRITALNRAAERLFGWSAAEAIGRSPPETFAPERVETSGERIA